MYGHPHRELLDRLSGNGIPCERTDRSGEIKIYRWKSRIRIKPFFQQADQKGLFRGKKNESYKSVLSYLRRRLPPLQAVR